MCLSIISFSSATRPKNTLPTPAVLQPDYPHAVKHVFLQHSSALLIALAARGTQADLQFGLRDIQHVTE